MPSTSIHVLTCREYGQVPLDQIPADRPLLDTHGRLRICEEALDRYVTIDFKNGVPRVQARGFVGLFELLPGVHLQVRPRFPVRNFTRMVATCGYQPAAASTVREYMAATPAEAWLSDVLADAFLDAVDVIRDRGLLREYATWEGFSSFPRGRLDAKETIRRAASRGMSHAAAYRWHERTVDNGPNRLIKAAALYLHGRYKPDRRASQTTGTRRRVARIAEALRLVEDAGDDRDVSSIDDYRVRDTSLLPEARAYYQDALTLAKTILLTRGLDLDRVGPGALIPSLVINSEDLFERYIREWLQVAFRSSEDITVVDGNRPPAARPLYQRAPAEVQRALLGRAHFPAVRADALVRPDLLIRAHDGSYPVVADAKYTPVSGATERTAVEQVVLYAIRYASSFAMTIHPSSSGTDSGLHVVGRVGRVTVVQYRLDLNSADLDAEMSGLAASIRTLAAVTPAA